MEIDLATITRDNPQLVTRNLLPILLNNAGLVGNAIEIGTQHGFFSERLLQYSRLHRLYSVDPWTEMDPTTYVDGANVAQELQDYRYLQTVMRLNRFGRRSAVLRMLSEEAAGLFGANALDFVYIDGDHSFEGCAKDLQIWWPRLRSGALLAGHDYLDGVFNDSHFGVKAAVDGFVAAHGLTLWVTNAQTEWEIAWPTWYLFKP